MPPVHRLRPGVLVLSFSFAGCSSAPQTPSDVVKNFYKYVIDGKQKKAYSLLTEEFLEQIAHNRDLDEVFTKRRERLKNNEGLKELITDASTGEVRAVVEYVIKHNNGWPEHETAILLKRDDKWRIHDIK